ncbi:hypothetical protein NRI_0143 [Neorickettsia risticii str. Illinois]|uniref:Uncharacterized protein n=1 Tax=Neorickettsia risticii (strain Illinois) TaxID=434131 RepID=C6V423_NEORI|nr:hypothetical protein NRI_0143 [Neorickettsia risticii str. Illinois]
MLPAFNICGFQMKCDFNIGLIVLLITMSVPKKALALFLFADAPCGVELIFPR